MTDDDGLYTRLQEPLTGELRRLLVSEEIAEGINLLVKQEGDSLTIHIMAVSTGSLGMFLAAISEPGELDDPDSLSCRATPGDSHETADRWKYELIASRYPIDGSLVFSAKIRLPLADLAEVVSRLGKSH